MARGRRRQGEELRFTLAELRSIRTELRSGQTPHAVAAGLGITLYVLKYRLMRSGVELVQTWDIAAVTLPKGGAEGQGEVEKINIKKTA